MTIVPRIKLASVADMFFLDIQRRGIGSCVDCDRFLQLDEFGDSSARLRSKDGGALVLRRPVFLRGGEGGRTESCRGYSLAYSYDNSLPIEMRMNPEWGVTKLILRTDRLVGDFSEYFRTPEGEIYQGKRVKSISLDYLKQVVTNSLKSH